MLLVALAHATAVAHTHADDLTAVAGLGGVLILSFMIAKLVRKVDRWTTPH